jgi:hypothetical protein
MTNLAGFAHVLSIVSKPPKKYNVFFDKKFTEKKRQI